MRLRHLILPEFDPQIGALARDEMEFTRKVGGFATDERVAKRKKD